MITRRSILRAAALPLLLTKPALALNRGLSGGNAPQAISPDGTRIMSTQLGALSSQWGTWQLDSSQIVVPPSAYAPSQFFYWPLLNGKRVANGTSGGFFNALQIDHGGQIYGASFDQAWYQWGGYQWFANNGTSFASGPSNDPAPPLPPIRWAGPYMPSADGTTITTSGPTLQTADGIWTIDGLGNLTLNGLNVAFFISGGGVINGFTVNMVQVNAGGQLFFRTTDNVWHYWGGYNPQGTLSAPTGSPVPIGIHLSAISGGQVYLSCRTTTPLTTSLCTVNVTMSDGSGFGGTYNVGSLIPPDWTVATSGANVTIATTPHVGGYYFGVIVGQNSAQYAINLDVQVPS